MAQSPQDTPSPSRNPVGWFEIYVEDMARAKSFYTTVFGYEFTRLDSAVEVWSFPGEPARPGICGALVHIPGFSAKGNGVVVYFSCADCAVEAGRVEAAGGRIEKLKFAIGEYGFIALAFDTEGNLFGLHSMS